MRNRFLASLALLTGLVGPASALEIGSIDLPGSTPTQLKDGEIRVNRADGRLFYKSQSGTVAGGLLPDLDASGYLKFRNGMTLGRYQNGKFISQPDGLEMPRTTGTWSDDTVPGAFGRVAGRLLVGDAVAWTGAQYSGFSPVAAYAGYLQRDAQAYISSNLGLIGLGPVVA